MAIKTDIVSGFLGAGKTTLIKKLLEACVDINEKVVLLENEFGEIGIDGDMVRIEGFEVLEIARGCICCTMKDDFVDTLKKIVEKIKPDRVIFETSGVVFLSSILKLISQPMLNSHYTLNSVISVIDAVNFIKLHDSYSYIMDDQIKNSTKLILSKTQLVNESVTKEIIENLKSINFDAEIITKKWEELNIEDIYSLLKYNPGLDIEELLDNVAYCVHDKNCSCHVHKNYDGHYPVKRHGLETFSTKTEKVFSKNQLECLLGDLINQMNGEILRGKGFLKSDSGFLEFSYVNGQYSISEINSQPFGKVCFIGKDINRQKMSACF